MSLNDFIRVFQETLKVDWYPSRELSIRAEEFLSEAGEELRSVDDFRASIVALTNGKLSVNGRRVKRLIDELARHRYYFNYHEKVQLEAFYDREDLPGLLTWLESRSVQTSGLDEVPFPATLEETIKELHAHDDDARHGAVVESLFRGSVYMAIKPEYAHKRVNKDCRRRYFSSFSDHLRCFYPQLFERRRALVYIDIDPAALENETDPGRALCDLLRDEYPRLHNHSYLAVRLRYSADSSKERWKWYGDLVLFAEKYRHVPLRKGYFRPDRIKAMTKEYIVGLDLSLASFELANEGYFYKDCFVVRRCGGGGDDLLLLFQKNERDETPIPCPACRSLDIRGNSYPTLGVRSWECINLFCPDTSKYNRGKRYSALSLIMQEAINNPRNEIEKSLLRKWKLDVVPSTPETIDSEILEMLVKFYSLEGDEVIYQGVSTAPPSFCHRVIRSEQLNLKIRTSAVAEFWSSPWFARYIVDNSEPEEHGWSEQVVDSVRIICGDAFEVLSHMESESFDGVVTSPPYYNAREYAQWPNIYCYLHDMYNINKEVYRVLKYNSAYIFNIFDYFDNENTVVLSDMGKKRIVLGACIVDLFRRIGFKLHGNIVWDKGEIEGTRAYNQGNLSPFYQAPLNCWEHVFVFAKGSASDLEFPEYVRMKPVIKMVRGENVLGHSAPFPKGIPDLLIRQLPQGSTVLDPFAGSMTTGCVALERGLNAVCIDYQKEYCDLGAARLKKTPRQPSLF